MGAPKNKTYKRSWRNILLDKGYQLPFTLVMVGVSALCMVGLGWWVLSVADDATSVALNEIDGVVCPGAEVSEAPEPDGQRQRARPVVTIDDSGMAPIDREPAAADTGSAAATTDTEAARREACVAHRAEQKQSIVERRERITVVLVGVGVLLVVGLFVYGLKMTHRVAGPLYKVRLYMAKLEKGKYDTVYDLRRGDQLVEFYRHFKAAHAGLRRLQQEDRDRLAGILIAADTADLAARSPELAAAIDELRALLAEKEDSLG